MLPQMLPMLVLHMTHVSLQNSVPAGDMAMILCISSLPLGPDRPGMQILSEDYSKAAFLCADRTVRLHARYGAHYHTRIPRAGRDLAFAPASGDLLVVGSSSDIYRCTRVNIEMKQACVFITSTCSV